MHRRQEIQLSFRLKARFIIFRLKMAVRLAIANLNGTKAQALSRSSKRILNQKTINQQHFTVGFRFA